MLQAEPPPQSKRLDEVLLWVPVALFLALGIAWAVYPRAYLHDHPGMWPVVPPRWKPYADSSPTLVYFFLAFLTCVFGLWQTRFSQHFKRDSSSTLSWLYVLFSLVFAIGSWTFDLGSRFWTLPFNNGLYAGDRALEIGRIFIKFGLYTNLAAALLNVTYSSFRERRVSSSRLTE